MFEHLDDPLVPTPAPLERVTRLGRRIRLRHRAAIGAVCSGVAVVAAGATGAFASGPPARVRTANIPTAGTAAKATTTAPPRRTTSSAPAPSTLPPREARPRPLVPRAPVVTTPASVPAVTTSPAPHADLVASATPARVTLHAGDALTITLRVTNRGDAEGSYWWAPDGCGRSLAVDPGRICPQVLQTVRVRAGETVDKAVPVDTSGAAPGVYTVAFETLAVTVTVLAPPGG
jgi:hypothetical protein